MENIDNKLETSRGNGTGMAAGIAAAFLTFWLMSSDVAAGEKKPGEVSIVKDGKVETVKYDDQKHELYGGFLFIRDKDGKEKAYAAFSDYMHKNISVIEDTKSSVPEKYQTDIEKGSKELSDLINSNADTEKINSVKKKLAECYYESGKIVYEEGKNEKLNEKYEIAIINFKKSIELDKSNFEFRVWLGYSLIRLEKYKEALAEFNEVLAIPGLSEELKGNALNGRGATYIHLNKKELAVKDYKEGAECNNPYCINNLKELGIIK